MVWEGGLLRSPRRIAAMPRSGHRGHDGMPPRQGIDPAYDGSSLACGSAWGKRQGGKEGGRERKCGGRERPWG